MKACEYIDVDQSTPEWHALRAGIPTASRFADVMQKAGPRGGKAAARRTYLMTLLGERLTGEVLETYQGGAIARGHALEPEARNYYEMMTGLEAQVVGFAFRDDVQAGASPDSLIGDDGLLEIKTKAPHHQLEVLIAGVLPDEHVAQVQGQLWITQRQWCDFVSYWPGLPTFVIRVERDEAFIAQIAKDVAEFNTELIALEAKIRKYSKGE